VLAPRQAQLNEVRIAAGHAEEPDHREDILARIRSFFGLDEEPRARPVRIL